jgi:hypothetical protein
MVVDEALVVFAMGSEVLHLETAIRLLHLS